MKEIVVIVMGVFFVMGTFLTGIITMTAMEEGWRPWEKTQPVAYEFDPNDPLVPFLSTPPETWLGKFGDSERSRTIYTIAELRVLNQQQQKMLDKLNAFCFSSDPNAAGGAK